MSIILIVLFKTHKFYFYTDLELALTKNNFDSTEIITKYSHVILLSIPTTYGLSIERIEHGHNNIMHLNRFLNFV